MKTLKLIILVASISIIFHSCSTDRDDVVNKEQAGSVKTNNKKEIKLNKIDLNAKNENSIISDTIKIHDSASGTAISTKSENGEEPIVDPTKPDKPW